MLQKRHHEAAEEGSEGSPLAQRSLHNGEQTGREMRKGMAIILYRAVPLSRAVM